VAPASNFGGNTEGDKVCVNIFRHHGSSSNHCTVSYVNSVQDLAAGTDPNIVADANALDRQRLDIHRLLNSSHTVICRHDDCVRTDHRIPTDNKASMPIEDAIRADIHTWPDLDAAAVWRNKNAIGNRDSLRDPNASSQ
jgi:hypothetical protein